MFEEEVDDRVVTLANRNLFTTFDDACEELDEQRSEIFYSVTAKLLFIIKCGRPDAEMTISYLMTSIQEQ